MANTNTQLKGGALSESALTASESKEEAVAFGPHDTNDHFIDCIRKGRQPETNFEDGVKTMVLVDAIYEPQI